MLLRPEHAREALARWDGFPVDQDPRPIVLTGLHRPVQEWFSRHAEWRSRFDGPGEPESTLPPELRADAVDFCRDTHTLAPQPLAPLFRGAGPFSTDRGVRELPVWMMHPPNRRWPFIAMDPEFRRRMTWRPDGLETCEDEESTLAADGRTLTYRFSGMPAVYAAYPHADVYETDTAVLIHPVEVDLTGPDDFRLEHMEKREVVVRLAAPLGNRVLVWEAHGQGAETFGAPRTVLISE